MKASILEQRKKAGRTKLASSSNATARMRYSAKRKALAPRLMASEMSTTFLFTDVSTSPSSPTNGALMLESAAVAPAVVNGDATTDTRPTAIAPKRAAPNARLANKTPSTSSLGATCTTLARSVPRGANKIVKKRVRRKV